MDGRTTENPPATRRLWKVLSEDVAAGYERDSGGGYVLFGLVMFQPTSDKLRDIKLRDIERTAELWTSSLIEQDAPPDPGQVSRVWAHHQHVRAGVQDFKTRWLSIAIESATRRENLTRRESDSSPDDFYRRIAEAHRLLSQATAKPTAELATRAGVPVGTAAGWVSRAKARGMYPSGVSHSIDEQGQPHRG